MTMTDEDIDDIGFMLEDKGLSHSEIDVFFEHHGVKGMRWGVRRRGRVERTVNVGKGKGSVLDKARVYTMSNPFDLIGTGSFRKSASRKGARMVRRNNRLAKKGKAKFFRDVYPTLVGTRYTDILPTVRGSKLTADKKRDLKRVKQGKEIAIALVGTGVAAAVIKSAVRAGVRKAQGG